MTFTKAKKFFQKPESYKKLLFSPWKDNFLHEIYKTPGLIPDFCKRQSLFLTIPDFTGWWGTPSTQKLFNHYFTLINERFLSFFATDLWYKELSSLWRFTSSLFKLGDEKGTTAKHFLWWGKGIPAHIPRSENLDQCCLNVGSTKLTLLKFRILLKSLKMLLSSWIYFIVYLF